MREDTIPDFSGAFSIRPAAKQIYYDYLHKYP
jgi:hypothetical protein